MLPNTYIHIFYTIDKHGEGVYFSAFNDLNDSLLLFTDHCYPWLLATHRQTGQNTAEEVRARDLHRELEEKESEAREKRGRDKPRSFTGESVAAKRAKSFTGRASVHA